MQIEELVRGGNIEIEAKLGGQTMSFKGTIELLKDNSVLINPIKVNEQTVGFSDKCIINFYYKVDGKLFAWENVSVKLVKLNGAVYHKIDLVGDGKPFNRRDAYRMYIGEDMPVYVNTANGPNAISVLVKDISETGMGFITKEEIDVDRTIRIKIKDNGMVINLSAVVIRKDYLENLQSYLYGCKFNEKNLLLGKYIAKKQEEFLKKKNSAYSANPSRPKKSN